MKKNDFIYELAHDKFDDLCSFSFELPKSASTHCYSAPLHFHHALEITYITKGTVKCYIGDKEINAEKDDIIFISPLYLHTYLVKPNSSYITLILSKKMSADFCDFFDNSTFETHLTNHDANLSLLTIFEILSNENKNFLIKKGLSDILFGNLSKYYTLIKTKDTYNTNFIIQSLEYIEKHYFEPLTLETIATDLGYNKYYFSRNFKHYIGENFNNYVNMLRVRQVLEQFKKHPEKSLITLIYDAGFNSLSTYYRAYKYFFDSTQKNIRKNKK